MDKLKVLVTGGAGYIGSHIVIKLVDSGYFPIIVDDFSNSKPEVIDRLKNYLGENSFEFIKHDLVMREPQLSLSGKLKYKGIFDFYAVIHLAAFKSVSESVHDPIGYYRNNINSTLSVLKLMEDAHCEILIYSSSCTVYGDPISIPVTEDSKIVDSLTPYGQSKIMCERIIRDAFGGIPELFSSLAINLRYFNPIGSHPSGLFGDDPNGIPNNVIPYMVKSSLGKLPTFHIHGNDYDTPDGTCIRDYIDVNDLAQAHVDALKIEGFGVKSYNVGTGNGTSVMELVNEFKNIDPNFKYIIGPRRSGDIPAIYADCNKFQRETGWYPKVSLNESLRSALEYERNQP
jgi:UDP-glucose 4-epimerase